MTDYRSPIGSEVNDNQEVDATAKARLRLWLRLLATTGGIEQTIRSNLRQQFETTLPRFDVLAQLDRAPDGLTMGALSSKLMVSAGNVTGLVERLQQEGLVTRRASETDRRSQLVYITPQGRNFFYQMTPQHEAWVGTMLAGLSEEDVQEMLRLLGKLKTDTSDK